MNEDILASSCLFPWCDFCSSYRNPGNYKGSATSSNEVNQNVEVICKPNYDFIN